MEDKKRCILSVEIPADLMDKIDAAAEEVHSTRSQYVRSVLWRGAEVLDTDLNAATGKKGGDA